MANRFSHGVFTGIGLGWGAAGSRTAFALDTAFTLGSAGKCAGLRFVAPATTTITDVLFFVSAAPASGRNISVNVCSQTSTTQPGAAVTNGTVSVSGGTTANKWIKATYGTPPSVTVGTGYWIVIGDPAGAASGYSVLVQGVFSGPIASLDGSSVVPLWRQFTSTDGFATVGSAGNTPATFVIVFGDGTYLGVPYTLTTANDSSAAVERGWLITPDEDVTISYITGRFPAGSMKVYESGQNPGGTVFAGFNGGAALSIPSSAQAIGCFRFPPCTLAGGATYRVVVDPSAATQSPGYTQIEDNTTHSAILEACGFPGIGMQHTEESGGTWVNSTSKLPRLFIGFDQLPAQTGGAGIAVLTGGGLAR
jgi:hypothetical protein